MISSSSSSCSSFWLFRDSSLWIQSNALFVGVVLSSWLGYLIWTKWWRVRIEAVKPFDELPMPAGNHFLLGHISTWMHPDFWSSQKMLASHFNENGRVGIWSFRKRAMMVSHWEDVRVVLLGTDFRTTIQPLGYHLNMALGADNFLILKGREWRFHRSAVLKSMTGTASVINQKRSILEVTSDLVQSLHRQFQQQKQQQNNKTTTDSHTTFLELDIQPLMKMATIDIFGKAALSADFQCCQHLAMSPVASAFDFVGHDLTRRLEEPLRLSNYFYSLPTKFNRQHYQARTLLRQCMEEIIQQRKQEQKQQQTQKERGVVHTAARHQDFLSLLLQANEEVKEQDQDLTSEATLRSVLLSLIFAGYDTTSVCLTYTLYLLATHPQEQQQCWEEVTRVISNTHSKDIGDSDVEDFVFCKGVIMESLRLYPPAFGTRRSVDKDLTLRDGFIIPAGTDVMMPTWTSHRMERHFPKPNEFHPDRWVQQQEPNSNGAWVDRTDQHDSSTTSNNSSCTIPAANRNAFFAFSAGSRSCPGQKFAMHEIIFILAALVQQFQFHPVPGYELNPTRNGVVQCPKDGMPLRLEPRQKQ